MPFRMMNAPSTFQALMNDVFKLFLCKHVLVFFDEILVYSQTWQQHIQHLSYVLQVMSDNKLVANKKKCSFAQCSMEYLVHIIFQ